ncbi:ACT domain-containing protein [Mesorhizobium sp. BAC0120]|uniref:ACT domain-containing protein n=1 Tax=Mesorhizobium sp. BAC0120 TaxID=3090670 RepID=UPI00298CBF3D|nr:ACT domain-containing protein [Mesorhizobium sp. BAC0120]MDW6022048.1 ACT domain-containing protein [Mesorhizobium sp. BAC0120]
MAGEFNLEKLLAGMTPRLEEGVYVFASLPAATAVPSGVYPLMTFIEAEGTTLVLEEGEADRAGVKTTFRSRMITLDVHSSLEAVGFLSVITTRLAAARIAVNPVSAFYHDHLFVPAERAEEAVEILEQLVVGKARHKGG